MVIIFPTLAKVTLPSDFATNHINHVITSIYTPLLMSIGALCLSYHVDHKLYTTAASRKNAADNITLSARKMLFLSDVIT